MFDSSATGYYQVEAVRVAQGEESGRRDGRNVELNEVAGAEEGVKRAEPHVETVGELAELVQEVAKSRERVQEAASLTGRAARAKSGCHPSAPPARACGVYSSTALRCSAGPAAPGRA